MADGSIGIESVGPTRAVGPGLGSDSGLSVSWPWAMVAVTSLVALWTWAPGGLQLLGFLGVIIVTHEAGHFFMARRVGMCPTEFFWGFGPEVVAFNLGGCRYGLKALFLGGYVKLEGMTPESELPPGFAESGTYRAASHRGRLATILAGPGVNLVSAVLAFALAAALDGAGAGAAVVEGFEMSWLVISTTVMSLATLVADMAGYLAAVFDWSGTTEAPVRFLSPVGQAAISSRAVDLGAAATLQWFGVLACAIGAINLLPLPPLDGSHGAVAVVEGVVQRFRRDRTVSYNVARLVPVAYFTIGALVVLSVTALVMDLRDLV